jgi:predicted transcriptional regulator
MATNLRLQPDIATALRAESARTGRPQQQIIRDAVAQYLTIADSPAVSRAAASDATLAGLIRPARRAFGTTTVPPLTLREGETTADLLDRDDRF